MLKDITVLFLYNTFTVVNEEGEFITYCPDLQVISKHFYLSDSLFNAEQQARTRSVNEVFEGKLPENMLEEH